MNKRNILLTGASRGLGLAIAERLLEDGASVYAVNRSMTDELKALQTRYSDRLQVACCDLADMETLQQVVFEDLIGVDIPITGFVNNAARAYDDIITNLRLEALEQMYRVNVFAPMMLTKGVLRNMLLHSCAGSIVHISSVSAHTGYKGLAMYASTKGALEAFSKNSAREWGARKIRSNCVVCGFMETDMSAALTAEQKERVYKRCALKQATDPQSAAAMVAHLLSKEAESITGQNVFVDSGTI